MQIVFDLVGKCSYYGKTCRFYDGEYRSDSPCGGCERNPKIKQLTDRFEKPESLPKPEDVTLPDRPEEMTDKLTEIEDRNRRELGDWGIRPSAKRGQKGS